MRIIKRIKELGLKGTIKRTNHRIRKKIFASLHKPLAKRGFSYSNWKQIFPKNDTCCTHFLDTFKQNDPVEQIRKNDLFINNLPQAYTDETTIFTHANNATKNSFIILGSITPPFNNDIPWHTDFTRQDKKPFPNIFYQEIQPSTGITKSLNDYEPDIKIPWELSRFHHLFFLGTAYELTKKELYAQTFVQHINSWIESNQPLMGVNWACPMDVAIRAINWIWGFSFFKNSPIIPPLFWKNFINSLLDHSFYLEHNWETSDRPNNHYISDLVGYLYLCHFFTTEETTTISKQFKIKKQKTLTKIFEQFEHQILPDGTSYEGSTTYHALDAELFLHVQLLCETDKTPLPKYFEKKLAMMIKFINDCSIAQNQLVHIGDDDSGKIVCGLALKPEVNAETKTNHYSNFGITIIKNKEWHITFKHPTYQTNQPTGHFHQDDLAMTLSLNSIPILCDPGSYLYTPNAAWRNLMRSYDMHNTFYETSDNRTTIENKNLFQLNRNKQADTTTIIKKNDYVSVENFRATNKIKRKITLNPKKTTLYIEDTIEKIGEFCWNLIFHPTINIIQSNDFKWMILHENKTICALTSNLKFNKKQTYYSSGYSKKEHCTKLFCVKKVNKIPQQNNDSTLFYITLKATETQ